MLFNAIIRLNFTLKEVNFKNKNKQEKLSAKNWKYETKVDVNPGLSLSAFEQPNPDTLPTVLIQQIFVFNPTPKLQRRLVKYTLHFLKLFDEWGHSKTKLNRAEYQIKRSITKS